MDRYINKTTISLIVIFMICQFLLRESPFKHEIIAIFLVFCCYSLYRAKRQQDQIDEQGIWKLKELISWQKIKKIQSDDTWVTEIIAKTGINYKVNISSFQLLASKELNEVLFQDRGYLIFSRLSDAPNIKITTNKRLINPYRHGLLFVLGIVTFMMFFYPFVDKLLDCSNLKSLLNLELLLTIGSSAYLNWIILLCLINETIYLWGIFLCKLKDYSNDLVIELTDYGLNYQEKHIDFVKFKSLIVFFNHAVILQTKSGERFFLPLINGAMFERILAATGFMKETGNVFFSKYSR